MREREKEGGKEEREGEVSEGERKGRKMRLHKVPPIPLCN